MAEPTFQNLGFELAGAAPGLAAGWTLAFLASAEETAGFAPAHERPQEDFIAGTAADVDGGGVRILSVSTSPDTTAIEVRSSASTVAVTAPGCWASSGPGTRRRSRSRTSSPPGTAAS